MKKRASPETFSNCLTLCLSSLWLWVTTKSCLSCTLKYYFYTCPLNQAHSSENFSSIISRPYCCTYELYVLNFVWRWENISKVFRARMYVVILKGFGRICCQKWNIMLCASMFSYQTLALESGFRNFTMMWRPPVTLMLYATKSYTLAL